MSVILQRPVIVSPARMGAKNSISVPPSISRGRGVGGMGNFPSYGKPSSRNSLSGTGFELRLDGLPYEGKFPIPPTPLPRLMDGGTEIEFFAPIRAGDTITGRCKITDIYQKDGRSGPLIFVVRESTYTNQRGEVVLIEKGAAILR